MVPPPRPPPPMAKARVKPLPPIPVILQPSMDSEAKENVLGHKPANASKVPPKRPPLPMTKQDEKPSITRDIQTPLRAIDEEGSTLIDKSVQRRPPPPRPPLPFRYQDVYSDSEVPSHSSPRPPHPPPPTSRIAVEQHDNCSARDDNGLPHPRPRLSFRLHHINSAAGDSDLIQPTMLRALLLLSLFSLSLAKVAPEVAKIEKELSREVEEEFSRQDRRDELDFLKKEFSSTHRENASSLIRIPTELDMNVNSTDLFEGDIVLSPEQWRIALDINPSTRRRRQGLYSATQMWQPIGAPVIPYTFQPGFPTQYQQVVRDALSFWEQRTCIKFRLVNAYDTDAIIFNHNSNGCSSSVGRRPGGQTINLQAPGCMTVTIIAHELSHAFGTLHVQSRVDRDTYVQIDTSNIVQGMEHNFAMEPTSFSTYGLPYEFGSMQHYFSYAFSKDPKKPVIYARPNYKQYQGSMDGPRATFWDTVLINKMYKCTDKCAKQMACQNGGITDGADCNKCFCPRGWTGTNCEKRPADAQIVSVTDAVQSVKIEMKGSFTAFESKLIILQAPAGKRLEAALKSFGPYSFGMCRSVGLEIVQYTDTRTSGLRFCALPNPPAPVYSEANTMLLWLYRDVNYPVAVDVAVRSF